MDKIEDCNGIKYQISVDKSKDEAKKFKVI